ncbi:MAG: hypothetical protein U0Y68_19090 [Blastocatellia bacterium]
MRRVATVFLAALALSSSTGAHPLGDFTISHYLGLTIEAEQVSVRYIVEMAELATFQEFAAIDTNGNRSPDRQELTAYGQRIAQEYARGLPLTIDGVGLPWRVEAQQVHWQTGEGRGPTLRVECTLSADTTSLPATALHHLQLENTNHRNRSGWREIVVMPGAGINVFDSTAFGSGITAELTHYPSDLLTVLQEQRVLCAFMTGTIPAGAVALQTRDGRKVEARAAAWLISAKTKLMGWMLACLGAGLLVILGQRRYFPRLTSRVS